MRYGDDLLMSVLEQRGTAALPQLLERDAQLSELTARLEQVIGRSRGHVVLISGEAGIGKTALLHAFRDGLSPSTRSLWAACDPLFTPRPLGPLLDIALSTEGEFREHVQGEGKPHDIAFALMEELEAPAPTVLVIEDLHWADEATLDVVRLVARRIESVPALVALTYRDEELDRTHPLRVLLGELSPAGPATRMELDRLSRRAVTTLAEPAGVDPDVLYARTSGNPFFVTEALAASTEQVPSTVRDAVLARAARLGDEARAILDAVAIVPQRAELWLLEALAGGPLAALAEGIQAGMLAKDAAGIAFRHELARLAVEESLPPDRALILHRRAIKALRAPPFGAPDAARLAHHGDAAADTETVLRYAPTAAEQAATVGAHREAVEHYKRALRFARELPSDERAELLERFAREAYLTDMRDSGADALYEAIDIRRERGDVLKLGDDLVFQLRMLSCIGRAAEGAWMPAEAVKVLEPEPPGPELARAYGLMSGDALAGEDYQGGIQWGLKSFELAQQLGDLQAELYALNNIGSSELLLGVDEGEQKLARSLALARREGLGTDAGRAYINLVEALGQRREWPRAEPYVVEGIDYCSSEGLDAWTAVLRTSLTKTHLWQGRWTEAAEVAQAILDAPRTQVIEIWQGALLVLGLVRARRGEPQVWPLLDESLELAQQADDLQFLGPIAAARAEAAWLQGRPGAVAQETQTVLERAVACASPSWAGELACWRRRAGIEEQLGCETFGPFTAMLAGNWEAAARFWRERDAPYDEALALADSGEHEPMLQAHKQLQALGARPAAALVARRLREMGERGLTRGPRTQTRNNPAGLTARELDVLLLLAEGLRNREIAQRLIVSQKTVDHHVSSILRKLDARTRGEAAVAAVRLGLAEET
jgi:DNA-binding CsgD family transcriptional regulator